MDAVEKANSGHPGTPMGLAPLGYVLFTRIMRFNPLDPGWLNRDRFILSPGHACMLQYSLLHLCGYDVSLEDIKSFRQWGSKCPGHPEYGVTPGVEISTGPLGQGFANGVGFALAEAHYAAEFNRGDHSPVDHHTYVICSDGDMEEGIASEAGSLAGNLGLGKLIAIYDDNEISIEGATHLAFHEEVAQRFDAYGWHVHECPHEATLEDIEMAIREAQGVTDRPSFITLPSHIGFGSPNKQDTGSAHGSPLGEEEIKLTKENLGWPYGEPFTVPEEVRELFAGVRERGVAAQATWSEAFEAYAAEHEDLASEFLRVTRRHAPKLPPVGEMPTFEAGGDEIATRAASGKALNWLAPQVPELLGGAADLAPSTATNLDDFPDVLRHDFGGRNLHFGIREHAMGAIVNALTIEGMRAYGATFLVFSDYMRGAIRMAALMEIPSIFIYTHDSIGVGEDGPTHQPIEHLASLRAMPNLDVIRPADVNEAFLAWHWLLGEQSVPTALVLSRQKLPVLDRDAIPDDAIARGAYVLREADGGEPELILIGTGSEVSLCLEAADELAADGIAVRVVSMPSSPRFRQQDDDYRDSVLPPEVTARVSVEAGSTLGWNRWVGDGGISVGLDHFGASAPAAEVAEHFGMTAPAVAAKARELLGR
ncbi:MAG: transketolase [Solirubrobacterales bacterium]|nr:transketolase [Solirubrobacterales bacterium]MCB8970557.1 transketolase [Thermoleophilales bacterium]